MTATAITYIATLEPTSCGVCAIPFGLPRNLLDKLRDDGSWFWCPNGHKIHYGRTTEMELREQLEAEQRRTISARSDRDRAMKEAAHAEAKARGYKGAMVQAKKRAAKGVCPAPGCKRSFADVARHVASKHPDYEADPA